METKYKLIVPLVRTLMLYDKNEDGERVKNLLIELEKKNIEIQNLSLELSKLENEIKKERIISLASGSAMGFIGGMAINGSNR